MRVILTTSGRGTESKLIIDGVGLGIASRVVEFISKSLISKSTRYERPFSSVRKSSCRTIQTWGMFTSVHTYQVSVATNRGIVGDHLHTLLRGVPLTEYWVRILHGTPGGKR